jgi:hypothetical protein
VKYALFAVTMLSAGLFGGLATAQNYPTRDPNDYLHGGPIENGVRHQPTQAEIEARARTTQGADSQSAGSGKSDDELYQRIKQAQKLSILNNQESQSADTAK